MIKFLAAVAIGAAVAATGCSSTSAQVSSLSPGSHHATSPASTATTAPSGQQVESTAVAGATTYRLVYQHTGCPGPCNPQLQSAPTGTANWADLRQVTSGFGAAVAANGSLVVVTVFGHPAGGAPSAHATYLISSDAGATWRTRSDPCGGRRMQEWDTAKVAVTGQSIAGLCERRLAPPTYAVVVSHDAGQTFTLRRAVTGHAHHGHAWLLRQVSAA